MTEPQFISRDRHVQDPQLAVIANKLSAFENGFDEMKSDMRKMAEAVTKLAIVEERQNTDRLAQERAFQQIAGLAKDLREAVKRVEVLEVAAPSSKRANEWIEKGLWTMAGLALMYIAKKVGLVS